MQCEKGSTLYVPVDRAESCLRKVITEEEAWDISHEIPQIPEAWIDNEKLREQTYKEAIQSCDPKALISIIKCMYLRKQKRTAKGKKNTIVDERYFKLAENNLYEELAFALGKDKESMIQIITDSIKNCSNTN